MRWYEGWLKAVFALVVLRPLVEFFLAPRLLGRHRLLRRGPAIIIANHNSHFDAMVLISLLPFRAKRLCRPVGAGDYFASNPLRRTFFGLFFGAIFIDRQRKAEGAERTDPLRDVHNALEQGQIVIFFPEGSRGEPERPAPFKKGLAYLAAAHPETPVIPVWLNGLGHAWPKGVLFPVPLCCRGAVGHKLPNSTAASDGQPDIEAYLETARQKMDVLARLCARTGPVKH